MADDILVFKEEAESTPSSSTARPWKILVADDDVEIHTITQLVLRDFNFDGRGVELLSAYSALEAREILSTEKNIAVVLLDVVMETDDAGLQLVDWIRNELGNSLIRIILRTGQPGAAPEKQVIAGYEINDYKSKTEITDIKLYTAITVAIRGYRDLRIIKKSKEGLDRIIKSSSDLFRNRSYEQFYVGVLTQLTSLLKIEENSMYLTANGLALTRSQGDFRVLATTGEFERYNGLLLSELGDNNLQKLINKAIQQGRSIFEGNHFIGYLTVSSREQPIESIILLQTLDKLSPMEQEVIQVFSSNVSAAFANLHMNQQIELTQREIIFTLGEVVESRSKETGNHVRRVGAYAGLIAEKLDLSDQDIELIRLAAPMHDVGKIGIPDSILNKPGALTPVEMLEMRSHTKIGHDILKGGQGVLKLAADIALTHHEWWNGQGYPQGLAGEDIPIGGRITAIADVFDALTHDRVYKSKWPIEDVIQYLVDSRATQFDPTLLDIFVNNMDQVRQILKELAD